MTDAQNTMADLEAGARMDPVTLLTLAAALGDDGQTESPATPCKA